MLKKTLLSGVLLVSALAFAQENMMPKLPEEMKKLEGMAGEWTGKMVWVMPGMEGEMTSTLNCKMEGMFMRMKGVHKMAGAPDFTEDSYFGWDPQKKEYVSYTFTNWANLPRIEHGKVDGDKFIFTSEPWFMEGQNWESRATITHPAKNKMHMELEFKMEGKWSRAAYMDFEKK